jgi:putative transposase
MYAERHTNEQIIGILQEVEAGRNVKELARVDGIASTTVYRWHAEYGGLAVNEAKRLRTLKDENRRLKHLVADLTLDNHALKAVALKKVVTPRRAPARSAGRGHGMWDEYRAEHLAAAPTAQTDGGRAPPCGAPGAGQSAVVQGFHVRHARQRPLLHTFNASMIARAKPWRSMSLIRLRVFASCACSRGSSRRVARGRSSSVTTVRNSPDARSTPGLSARRARAFIEPGTPVQNPTHRELQRPFTR